MNERFPKNLIADRLDCAIKRKKISNYANGKPGF